jgi:hypothetical protein
MKAILRVIHEEGRAQEKSTCFTCVTFEELTSVLNGLVERLSPVPTTSTGVQSNAAATAASGGSMIEQLMCWEAENNH